MIRNKLNTTKTVKGIFIMLFLCLNIAPIFAQKDTINSAVISTQTKETSIVEFRIPDKNKILEYQNDPRFQYKKVEREISWWDKLWLKIWEFLGRGYSNVVESRALSVIVVIAIVLIVCLIAIKVLGIDYRTLLGKKEIDTPEIDIYTENVHDMNFDELISKALQNKDYRLAVRFLYLKNLKILSDKEIIEWSANKTNYSYQYEINNNSVRSKFLEVTLIFDYIWYGEFPLDENKYSHIHALMSDFSNMLSYER